jgi:hypothetical protein
MHRVLLPFEFFEPTTVKEVLELLDGEKTKVLAGENKPIKTGGDICEIQGWS